jgi:hypothetical protein
MYETDLNIMYGDWREVFILSANVIEHPCDAWN